MCGWEEGLMANPTHWFKRLFGEVAPRPRVPDGTCVYAVGDIHGRHDLLLALLDRIWADASGDGNILIFLGDYVDRGPASKAVVEHVMGLERPGWDIIKLMGNHEFSLLEFVKNPEVYLSWRMFGGTETLMSYGVRPPLFSDPKELQRAHGDFLTALPREHFAFLTGLPFSHTVGDYFFVHAGVRPAISLQAQAAEDMLWIRDDFLICDQWLGKLIVHGHTPEEEPVVRSNRIGIDTGAYATGRLTAVKLSEDRYTFLSTDGT